MLVTQAVEDHIIRLRKGIKCVMESILTTDELEAIEEFRVEDESIGCSKYIRLKAEIEEYDAKRLLEIICELLKKLIKERNAITKSLKAILRGIVKNLPKESPEEILKCLSKTKLIKHFLISNFLNKNALKKFSLKARDIKVKRDKNNILHLTVDLEVINFTNLLNAIKKEVSKVEKLKYKDLIGKGITALNSEVEEETKASFVYQVLGSIEFGHILEEVQLEVLELIKGCLQDFCKLDVELQSIHLESVEKETH